MAFGELPVVTQADVSGPCHRFGPGRGAKLGEYG
jgi:hypothetical protein